MHFLGIGHGVRRGQQATEHTEFVVYDVDQRSGTVGGARRVRHHVHCGFVSVEIYAFHKHRDVFAGRAEYDFFGAPHEVFLYTRHRMCICLNTVRVLVSHYYYYLQYKRYFIKCLLFVNCY